MKYDKWRVAAHLFIAMLVAAACRPGPNTRPQTPGTLLGTVLLVVTNPYTHLQTETGLPAATLEFLDSASANAPVPTVIRAITDPAGHYELPAVPPGSYVLRAIVWDSKPDDPPYFKCTLGLGGGAIGDRTVWIYSGEKANAVEVFAGKQEQRQIRINFSSECARNYNP